MTDDPASAATTRNASAPHQPGALRRLMSVLHEDLVRDAFALRPLPSLQAVLPGAQPVTTPQRAIMRWLPHLVIGATALVVSVATASDWENRSLAPGTSTSWTFLGSVLVGLALPAVLMMRVGAWWLSIACNLAIYSQGLSDTQPWLSGAFITHNLVMAVVAARSRPRVAVEMWVITAGLSMLYELSVMAKNEYEQTNGAHMAITSMVVMLMVMLVRGWWQSGREVNKQIAVTAVERSKRTLLEERTTIARELHDVVAHHMSVVAIQAEAAPYRVTDPPPELVKAFVTIRENALTALTELRRVLGVVRAADYEAPDAPQPTLTDLDALLTNVREAGLHVEKAVTGAVRELPPGIELTAYRIIQEALSNSLRHAPGALTRVEISYVLGGLGLRVVNGPPRGTVAPSPGAGHGITGMRERVTMLGGEMTCGSTGDGGYEMAAFLPLRPTERQPGDEQEKPA